MSFFSSYVSFFLVCLLFPRMSPFSSYVSFLPVCLLFPRMSPFSPYVSFFPVCLLFPRMSPFSIFIKKNCEWVIKFSHSQFANTGSRFKSCTSIPSIYLWRAFILRSLTCGFLSCSSLLTPAEPALEDLIKGTCLFDFLLLPLAFYPVHPLILKS